MKRLLIFSLLIVAPSAHAMSPAAQKYLRKIGIDPASEDARIADQDGTFKTVFHNEPREFSLEERVAKKIPAAVAAFVATRGFVARLKKDYAGTSMLKKNYDPMYLKPDEKQLVGKKVAEDFIKDR